VYDVAAETPLDHAPRLSHRLENRVMLKREDLQPVFSFKLRGAYNKIAHLSESAARRGVICASAGNHAQGVALAAQRRGIPAVIVMPQTTPSIKVNAVRNLGGEVVLHGDDYDSAYDHAQSIVRDRNLVFVHPFDDPDVIAGQGTIGAEILRQTRGDLDAIFVPVGGGGLISGIAVYAKYLNPKIKIIGVEPVDAAAMHDSMRAKKRVVLDRVGIFADGVAVRKVGEETFRLCREHVDEIVLVNTDEICAGIQDIFEDTRSIVEGMHEHQVALAHDGLRVVVGTVVVVAVQHHLAAEVADRGHLDAGRGLRHHDHRRDAAALGRQRHALRVVAGRGADHAAPGRGLGQVRDLVVRAAQLEREHRLQVLALEHHAVFQALREARRMVERRFGGHVVDAGLEDSFYVVVGRHAGADTTEELAARCEPYSGSGCGRWSPGPRP
jgi:biosynthetic threonine ammonia-lyase long form